MSFNTEQYPGVADQAPKETDGFRFNHTMLRVKDPERSLAFYSHVLGMRVLRRLDFDEMEFSLYFLAKPDADESLPEDVQERTRWTFSERGILELTHNWGTEKDLDFEYHDGNSQPQGFGHICFSVPNLEKAVAWFDANDVNYVKRPEDGKMKHIAFIKDPDGYWIEIVQAERMAPF
ncbi:lactoylglutathione lyase [Marinimicrobium sp. C6131]|uniref:lactoylglutathione lyase n=1 Tax=Marinimicrobium sp. C6131 TaxID=3022676 RepID=UPI00223D8FDD|nr:lactoylglutathione lyase [Marinimicrobium sp. C6131]UZJ43096.1 lactoylglutathione lyase [Marinimicrobium sp. C6131]